jgi:MFS family permease
MTGNPAENAVRKAARRLIPFLIVCYAVNFLDRVNVGFAALAMNEDLGFSPEVFGFGAGIFFVGYILCEVPSNLALQKFGARIWIARIMISWGLVATAMGFITGAASFYALRFLLGVAEAGFFPGIILYLTYWFPREERARIVSLFMTAVPFATVIGVRFRAPCSNWTGLAASPDGDGCSSSRACRPWFWDLSRSACSPTGRGMPSGWSLRSAALSKSVSSAKRARRESTAMPDLAKRLPTRA